MALEGVKQAYHQAVETYRTENNFFKALVIFAAALWRGKKVSVHEPANTQYHNAAQQIKDKTTVNTPLQARTVNTVSDASQISPAVLTVLKAKKVTPGAFKAALEGITDFQQLMSIRTKLRSRKKVSEELTYVWCNAWSNALASKTIHNQIDELVERYTKYDLPKEEFRKEFLQLFLNIGDLETEIGNVAFLEDKGLTEQEKSHLSALAVSSIYSETNRLEAQLEVDDLWEKVQQGRAQNASSQSDVQDDEQL